MKIKVLTLLIIASLFLGVTGRAQDSGGFAAEREAALKFALVRMSDRDALIRQRAAEVLAKLVAVEHLRLVEGYRLQEKNDRVRLALDWALYRMGKADPLYNIVRELRSDGRRPQAVGYLSQLESPRPLYLFFDRADGRTLVGLLQVMATIGDSDTIDLIKQFENSVEPGVPDAVISTTREITLRISQSTTPVVTRPRAVP